MKDEYEKCRFESYDKKLLKESGMQLYQVWLEGYAATGNEDKASNLGEITAPNFKDAVKKKLKRLKWDMKQFDEESLTYWGCRFFDNEADARKGFG